MSKEDKELAKTTEVGADLQAAVNEEKINRDIIKRYVSDQLIKGTDYGIIVGNKPTLLKPGMEKIFSLMKIDSRLEKDNDTWEMLGSTAGLVCYKCTLYRDGSDQPFAEGRGSAKVGEKSRDANSTVKIAEKRARMDACLSLGFSEFFTQDLEDMDHVTEEAPTDKGSHAAIYGSEKPASDKQVNFVRQLMVSKGHVKSVADSHALMEKYGVPGKVPEKLTMVEAKALIDALLNSSTPSGGDDEPESEYDLGVDQYGN